MSFFDVGSMDGHNVVPLHSFPHFVVLNITSITRDSILTHSVKMEAHIGTYNPT